MGITAVIAVLFGTTQIQEYLYQVQLKVRFTVESNHIIPDLTFYSDKLWICVQSIFPH